MMSTMCFAIEPTLGRVESRGRPRGIAMARSLIRLAPLGWLVRASAPRERVAFRSHSPVIDAPAQHAELDEGEQQDDQSENEGERRTEAELRLLEGGLENEQRHRAGRVERPAEAVREDVDRVKRAEHTDRRHSEDEERGR